MTEIGCLPTLPESDGNIRCFGVTNLLRRNFINIALPAGARCTPPLLNLFSTEGGWITIISGQTYLRSSASSVRNFSLTPLRPVKGITKSNCALGKMRRACWYSNLWYFSLSSYQCLWPCRQSLVPRTKPTRLNCLWMYMCSLSASAVPTIQRPPTERIRT